MSGATCGFMRAWVGPCVNRIPCPIHADVECCSCEKPATRECCETMGAFVCGFYLCDDCEHDFRGGTFGARFSHSPKKGRTL